MLYHLVEVDVAYCVLAFGGFGIGEGDRDGLFGFVDLGCFVFYFEARVKLLFFGEFFGSGDA